MTYKTIIQHILLYLNGPRGSEPNVQFLDSDLVMSVIWTRRVLAVSEIKLINRAFILFRMHCVRFRSGSVWSGFDRDPVHHSSGTVPGDHRETGLGVLETNTSRCD